MSLIDKFRIIENHIKLENEEIIVSKIENYFDNYINTGFKILDINYINQVIWFKKYNLTINIENQLKEYLIRHRNDIRKSIKNDNFELSKLNNFIEVSVNKLKYINDTINSPNNKLIIEGVKLLSKLIISDSIILLFIEKEISYLDKNLLNEIKILVNKIKNLAKYDSLVTFDKILMTFGNTFVKQIIEMEELPLPDNIRRIQKLNDIINYLNQVKEYFNFITDFNIIDSNINQIIFENLIDIIKYNSVDEIEYVFNQKSVTINNLMINKTSNPEILNNITNGIIDLITRSLKSLNNNNIDNIFKIINILGFCDNIIHQSQKEIINEKISLIFSLEETILDRIHINIDHLVRDHKVHEVIKLLKFTSIVKDKDIFISKYYQNLIKRLMEKISDVSLDEEYIGTSPIYFSNELDIIKFLKTIFNNKLTYKLEKVILDTQKSYTDIIFFNRNNPTNKMVVITTSYNNWDVNQNEGLVSSNIIENIKETQLGCHLTLYEEYYKSRYNDKRVLYWYPHFGEVNITYLDKEIKMLPIQFMILEMFNDTNQQNLENVLNAIFLKNYTKKFINDIINSIVSSKLFKMKNNKLILNQTNNFESDLIDIFFNISDYSKIWEQQRNEEIVLSREEIICANINHHIKLCPMTRNKLFEVVSESIDVFQLDELLFNKSLQYMCNMDYILLNEQMYQKIFY
jgi:hypothetical protein